MNTPTKPVFTEQEPELISPDPADALDDAEDADEFSAGVDDLAPISLKLDASSCGVRLDKVLSSRLPQYSRARLQQWIDSGHVLVDGKVAKARSGMLGDELITLQPQPSDSDFAFQPEPMALEVLHEDESIVVINKPVGLVVHPAAGNWQGTMLNGLLHRWPQLAGVPRAGIVHRLDKDTSGLLVVAKTLSAQTHLTAGAREFDGYGQFPTCSAIAPPACHRAHRWLRVNSASLRIWRAAIYSPPCGFDHVGGARWRPRYVHSK